MMTLKGASYLAPEGKFKEGNILIGKGKILSVGDTNCGGECLDFAGYRIIPGLIDVHTHGAIGIDAMTAGPESLIKLSQFLAEHGVTTFFPTTITSGLPDLLGAVQRIREAALQPNLGASIAGIHYEGPYISKKFAGCHDPNRIQAPDVEGVKKILSAAGPELLRRITIAPELEGARELIRFAVSNGFSVSIGHSGADYQTAMEALTWGASSFTHLFNAMRGIHHREPGTAAAGLLSDAYTELICDGIHVCPEIIGLIHRLKRPGKLVLITDSMLATGLADGAFSFGGMDITVSGGVARAKNNVLAGSTLLLINGVKNLMSFTGIPLEEAVLAATANPAAAVGLERITGSIESGKRADLVVVDEDLNVICTVCRGAIVYRRQK